MKGFYFLYRHNIFLIITQIKTPFALCTDRMYADHANVSYLRSGLYTPAFSIVIARYCAPFRFLWPASERVFPPEGSNCYRILIIFEGGFEHMQHSCRLEHAQVSSCRKIHITSSRCRACIPHRLPVVEVSGLTANSS